MATSNVTPNPQVSKPAAQAAAPLKDADRRRRRRAKISAQVFIKSLEAENAFEEICMSLDVSRDGLLFVTDVPRYHKGQKLDVTFPYSSMVGALTQGQPAEVVRLVPQPGGRHGIAVHFHAAKSDPKADKKGIAVRTAIVNSVAASEKLPQSVVLAVEPDPRGAESMRNLLEQDGYTVLVVPNGQAALEILRTTIPSVLIAEVESEDIPGQDLCVIVKQNERLQKVPVILMTRSAQPADYTTSHQLGAVVCMAKPFKPERLQQVVRLVAPPPALRDAPATRVV
jgi:CheY-like chemotaxis protein